MRAFTSLGLLAANVGIAIVVALVLVSGRYQVEDVIRLALAAAVVSVAWGVLQVAAYHLAGIDLSLSESQELQVQGGFASGFRTEANGFAKFLNVVFLCVLPSLLTSPKRKKALLIVGVLIAGMLASFTRSAIYGLGVTLILLGLWYLLSGRVSFVAPRVVLIALVATSAVAGFVYVVGDFNEYAAHKVTKFFDSDEILEGKSSGFRLMQQGMLWDAFLESEKTFLVGNGWGQVYLYFAGMEFQAGGSELATVFAYGGALGGVMFLLFQLWSINAARRMLKGERDPSKARLYEGVMFALISLPITGTMNSAMIAPEYWMLYGVAIYLGCAATRRATEKLPARSRTLAPMQPAPRAAIMPVRNSCR